MKAFQHIATFTYPSDLLVARGLLESMDIACKVKNELTVQVHNFYSNAIGGITLEVAAEKYNVAKKLLIESGFNNYLIDSETSLTKSKEILENRSVLNYLKLAIRFVVITAIALIVIALVLLISF